VAKNGFVEKNRVTQTHKKWVTHRRQWNSVIQKDLSKL
jgi:hypothetical protein